MAGSTNSGRPIRHLILDRDGVLNREASSGWITDPQRWVWEDGSLEALGRLVRLGLRVSIATNQSCIGRGVATQAEVDAVHHRLRSEAASAWGAIVPIYVCPHAPEDGCNCRKPRPGLLFSAIRDSEVPPEETVFVGDAERDLEAGLAAGLRVVLVRTGKGRATERRWTRSELPVFDNLLRVVEALERSPEQSLGFSALEPERSLA
ncbi:MAG: HAD-IIIA family hydrolase [Acidobacteriota bacterium]